MKYYVGRKGILDPYILTWKDLKNIKTSKKKKKSTLQKDIMIVFICVNTKH